MKLTKYFFLSLFLIFSSFFNAHADFIYGSDLSGVWLSVDDFVSPKVEQVSKADKGLSIAAFQKEVFVTDCCCDTEFLVKTPDGSLKRVADVDLRFYDIKSTKDLDAVARSYHSGFGVVFKKNCVNPLIYLKYLRIYDDSLKGHGLGKQLFEYGLQEAKKKYPKALFFWRAVPLDGQHKKEALFKFYKNCGGIMIKELAGEALFYIDLAKLPSSSATATA